jgi:hypothetical protein
MTEEPIERVFFNYLEVALPLSLSLLLNPPFFVIIIIIIKPTPTYILIHTTNSSQFQRVK